MWQNGRFCTFIISKIDLTKNLSDIKIMKFPDCEMEALRKNSISTFIIQRKSDNLPMAFGLITLFFGLIKISPPSYFLCSMASKQRFNFE